MVNDFTNIPNHRRSISLTLQNISFYSEYFKFYVHKRLYLRISCSVQYTSKFHKTERLSTLRIVYRFVTPAEQPIAAAIASLLLDSSLFFLSS